MNPSIVYTNKARCRDCYRCLRRCPVKAIRIHEGQAYVEGDLCIGCGTCIKECPQQAKMFRNDTDRVSALLQAGETVAVSLAPSYVSIFQDWERKRLPSALRKLGFRFVEETALGAEITAALTADFVRRHEGKAAICSPCPAVVNYIEGYVPDLLEYLVPVVSPMIAHARLIKARRGEQVKVVFIGPCIAKKMEAERPEYDGLVDAVLTFSELFEWFQAEGVRLAEFEESDFDEVSETPSRFFPLVGGLSRTAAFETDLLSEHVVAVSGFGLIDESFRDLLDSPRPVVIEPLFCLEGCINGPGVGKNFNVYNSKTSVIEFAGASARPAGPGRFGCEADRYLASFKSSHAPRHFSEEEIQKVLAQTGKLKPEDHLNCGACGYNSCREKAIAVLKGMAEPEMCIPYMKLAAERRTDRILETSPNGILVLDAKLNLLSMNPGFRKMFACTDALLGKSISYVFDPIDFEKLATGAEERIESHQSFPAYNLICHQLLYPLKDERQYVGIFVNVTHLEDTEKKLESIKQETIRQSRELLDHQVAMAQQIVKFLGESTAKSEELVKNIVQLTVSKSKKE